MMDGNRENKSAMSNVLISDIMPLTKSGPSLLAADNILDFIYHRHHNERTGEPSDYDTSLLELLIGLKGSFTELHCDFAGVDGWLLCISGVKLWMCVPNTHAAAFDAVFGRGATTSNMTTAMRKKVVDMGGVALIQTAGDIIVMRAGWYHWVFNVEESVSIGGVHLRLSGLPYLNQYITLMKTDCEKYEENINQLNQDMWSHNEDGAEEGTEQGTGAVGD